MRLAGARERLGSGSSYALAGLLTLVESVRYRTLPEFRLAAPTGTTLATWKHGILCVLAPSASAGEEGKRITWYEMAI